MAETTYARGEIALLSFASYWAAHCEERGLAWPAPKIAVEDGVAIARFAEQRVSVRAFDEVVDCFWWMTREAQSHWCPFVLCDFFVEQDAERIATLLDRRIPW